MKRFIKDILLCLEVLLVVFGGLEWIAESIPNSYAYKREYMEHHGPQIRTLILGSSYSYDGLSPAVLPDAFSLANSSQTPEDDYRLLSRYIGTMDSLQTVILGVGYGMLADGAENHRRTYYTIYMDLYPRWPLNAYSFEIFNLELLTKKIIKYAISRDVTRCDSLGQRLGHDAAAMTQGTEFWNKDIESLVANDRIDLSRDSEAHARNSKYIDSIASICTAHSVRLVVVAMPAKEEYRNLLPPEQLAAMDSLLAHLRDRAQCIDASDWPVPDDGWYNATHLTREASVAFTKKLEEMMAE